MEALSEPGTDAADPTSLDPAPGELPPPAEQPTLYFIGVTTGKSSIRRVFPRWAAALGLGEARLVGVDLPVHAPPADYRRIVQFIAADPRSRGALVTTHKLDLYEACRDLFDDVDALARLTGEISCLTDRGGRLTGSAKDPISSGLALDAFLPHGSWRRTGADACLLGAGGAATAISWALSSPQRGEDRPRRIVVTDRNPQRLDAFQQAYARFGHDTELTVVPAPTAQDNDGVVARLPAGSLVVNATGLGKDAPGSPLTDAVTWPRAAVAWDLNYRGDLVFLDQARRADGARVEDGWVYFLHGWTQVIADVFDVEIPTSGPGFERLSELAAGARG